VPALIVTPPKLVTPEPKVSVPEPALVRPYPPEFTPFNCKAPPETVTVRLVEMVVTPPLKLSRFALL